MSSPYDIIFVTSQGLEMFHGRTPSDDFPEHLFFGSVAARAFCDESLTPAPTVHDLGGTSHAGAVIDEVRRTLSFWSGMGESSFDVPMRRALVALMEIVWTGWTIRWARASELVAYLRDVASVDSESASRAFLDFDEDRYSPDYEVARVAEQDLTLVRSVLSHRGEDGQLRLVPARGEGPPLPAPPSRAGRWIRALFGSDDPDFWSTRIRLETMPSSGTHVDWSTRRLEFWSAGFGPTIRERIMLHYASEFEVIDHRDQFEWQLEACGGYLRLPERDLATLCRRWRQLVLNTRSSEHFDDADKARIFDAAERALITRGATADL